MDCIVHGVTELNMTEELSLHYASEAYWDLILATDLIAIRGSNKHFLSTQLAKVSK